MLLGLRTALFAVLSLARVALVARLIGPAELGLYGVLFIVSEAARAFTSYGATNIVLVQREKIGESDLATYWAFVAIQAAVAAAIVVVAAPFAVDASLRGRALPLGLVVALSVLVTGISNPGRVVAEREARFERISLLESLGAITDLVVSVSVAYWLRTAAAPAWGMLARATVEAGLSYALFSLPPRPALHREPARQYLRACGHFLAISAGAYVMGSGDTLMVASELGTVALGLYLAAVRLPGLAFAAFSSVINRVVFPVLSRLERTDPRFLRSVAMLMELQLLYLAAVAAALAVFAPLWVGALYGSSFAPSAVVLQAFSFVTIGRSFSDMVMPIILAVGRYDFASKVKGVEAAVFMVAVVIGVKTGGIVGVALGAGAAHMLAAGLRLEFLRRHVGVPGGLLARLLVSSFALSLASVAVAFSVRVLAPASGAWRSWLEVGIFATTFVLLIVVTRGSLVRAVWRLVRDGLRSRSAEAGAGA
jgi:O-antigen/teichoic acid export membrane protein